MEQDVSEVKNTLEAWANAYSQRDVDRAMSFIDTDENAVFFGSGVDERRVGWSELKKGLERDLAQAESISITTPHMTISINGAVAWTISDCVFDVISQGKQIRLNGRLTTILEKQGDRWLIKHLHFSLPALEQPEGESFPENK